ncbi:DUF4932 domain-containing protein [Maribellus comscasis]|uniref:DUF4932 domain-containing protein n=1 Tax=Maribellus comscasis TaxID=2681766 RepID=A0A6I6JUU8_9BACT|nr:DUF4932 domain-containing protein [Maribellus comscasis]QGY46856.1 DUF4932 domain-containing protein [Maribellus comscasis]
MKNQILSGLIIFLFISCETEVKNIEKKINIKVDERIELLSIVQHFTTWAAYGHNRYDLYYQSEVEEYFKPYSDHQAVKLCQELYDFGFSFDAPPTFVLYHSELPGFEQSTPYTEYLISRAGSELKLKEFANSLQNFAIKSNFEKFYNSQTDFYKRVVDSIKQTIPDENYIRTLENYYGDKKESYTIIADPLFQRGGYGPQIQSDDGELVYSILGAKNSINGFPVFGDKNIFEHIMLHEFSHSFVNPVTERYLKAVNNSENLFEPIENKMRKMAYPEWSICVNEHLVRVNVARMLAKLKHNKSDILKQEFNRGFIYIYDLDSLMEGYESSRNIFKKYEDFYPEIINYFDDRNAKK